MPLTGFIILASQIPGRDIAPLALISYGITQRGGEAAVLCLAAEGRPGLTRFIKTANENPAVILCSTSRRPKEHNAVRTEVFAAAAVSS